MAISRPRPKKLFNRKKLQTYQRPTAAAVGVTVTLNTGHMRMTFANPVSVNALPVEITANGLHPNAYTVVSPTILDLAFATPPVATNPWVIPAGLSEIKSSTGGVPAASGGIF